MLSASCFSYQWSHYSCFTSSIFDNGSSAKIVFTRYII
ncbi:hypothetical protein X975_06719, partial [Stegodyphus mimosarum]